ncbi:MAG: NAD(P)/FAD-dependent oxidoreductase, partial [Steroidobacteraceae bacterium]
MESKMARKPRQIVILGAGIVGSALAAELSRREGVSVTVLERGSAQRLVGSTGHAPGFVGIFNDAPVLTALARASVNCYQQLSLAGCGGFDRVGGLEAATTVAFMSELERRAERASDSGIEARILNPAEAAACAHDLIDPARCVGAVLYPDDGTARADVITAALRNRAARSEVRFRFDTAVEAIDLQGDRVTGVRTSVGTFRADDIVVACGIWGEAVAAFVGFRLPITLVAHPYVYGPVRGRTERKQSFVRWPERHVYARDHGEQLGLGTYDHEPLEVAPADLGRDAEQPWPGAIFDDAVARALDLLPAARRFT